MQVRICVNEFTARQAVKDEAVQLPHVAVLVPAGDWVLEQLVGGVDPADDAAAELRPVLVMANAQFRSLVEGITPADEGEIEKAIPAYIPGAPATPEAAPEAAPELGPAEA